jgi:uncharacterized phage infection (PIP) family protein YhgE
MAANPTMPDYAAQQAALIASQIKSEADRLNREYKSQLDQEIRNITAELKRTAVLQMRSIVLPVIGAVVAAFALLVYAQTRSLNSTYIEFQNGVMALQKEVLATSNSLGEKASLVAGANKELEAATRQLENKTAEYQSQLLVLENTQKEANSTVKKLRELADEYETRLKKSSASLPKP